MQHFKTLSAYFEYMQLPRPEHPMISVLLATGENFLPCPKESSPPITSDCYTISLKKIVKGVENIAIEYNNNQDEFSKDIIISQLSTLFKYANRFYERQFLNRKELSNNLLEQFNRQLEVYFESGQLQIKGIPSIEYIADKISVSQRYLSDTLKKETGKTSTEHLQLYLIDEAKNILLKPNMSISEVAYELGFEYPQYFSRLFKKKEGLSPSEYRSNHKQN